MRDFTGARFLLLLVPPVFILLPLAAVIVILNRISTSSLRGVTEQDWRTGDNTITLSGPLTTGSTNFTNIDVTMNFNPGPPIAILLAALVACFVAGLGGFGTWELRKVEGTPKYQRAWAWTVIISYLFMIGASVGVFGYATAVQNSDNGWTRYEDVSKPDQRYTRETWTCQIDKFFPAQDWAGRACGTARASRILMVVMAAAGLLAIGAVWFLIHDRGGAKWLFGGKGRYGGFSNYHEMQPSAPNPYTAQPSPQWPQQQQQQWMPPPQQQWGPPQQQWVPQQQWAPQQQWMPQQPVQQWGGQPNFQPVPQQVPVQKSGATAEERPVFR